MIKAFTKGNQSGRSSEHVFRHTRMLVAKEITQRDQPTFT